MVNRDVHFEQIAAICEVDVDLLRTLNPQYRRNIVNGYSKPSVLRLPQEAINLFIDNEDSVYNYRADVLLNKRYEVAIPDDIPQVSRPTRSSVKGKSGRGSHGRNARNAHKGRKGRNKGGSSKSVTVKSGQTLSEIARRNHTTVDKLKRLNGIKGSSIRAGKKLKVK